MATNIKGYKTYLDNYGPSGAALANASISLPIGSGSPTILESQGFESIVRSTTGTYVLTLLRSPLACNVTIGLGGTPAATPQNVYVISKVGKVITIRVATAASGAAADPTAVILLDVQALLRFAK
jgi:hypothetical protein